MNATNIENEIDEDWHDIYMMIDYSSTCTGSEPNSNYISLATLNIMNSQSMYNDKAIPENWENYVYTSIKRSIEVLKKGLKNDSKTETN